MRIRDKSRVETVTQSDITVTPTGVRTETYKTYSFPQRDVMTDTTVPRFHTRRLRGEVFVNPMEKHTSTCSPVTCPWWRQRKVSNGVYYHYADAQSHTGANDPVWAIPEVLSEVDRLTTLAVTSAYAEVGSADLDSLTELAELRETLGFLWSPVKKMRDITTRLTSYLKRYERWEAAYKARLSKWMALHPKKRGSKPDKTGSPTLQLGRFEASDVSSAWLAYRYAIMPLVYSFQDIQKHLDRTLYPERVTARGKSKGSVSLQTDPAWSDDNGIYGSIRYRQRRVGSAEVSVRAGVLYIPDWSLQRQLGLQMHQVPAAMYEVIPLSFVADWFYNGAEAYQAITAELRSQKILKSWVTVTVEYKYSYELQCTATSADTTCHPGGETLRSAGTWKSRREASFSDIGVRRSISLNTKRLADALALIHTMLTTVRKRP